MSDLNSVAAAVSAKYGVPLPLLLAIGGQESGMNPNTGDTRLPVDGPASDKPTGMLQMRPSTARQMGVNPRDPAQSLEGAAKYLRQGYDTHGNWDDAARYYFGGPNTKGWKEKTAKYHASVAARVAQTATAPPQAPSDPFEAALAGNAPSTPAPQNSAPQSSGDPFEDALSGVDAGPAPEAHQGNGDHRGPDIGRSADPHHLERNQGGLERRVLDTPFGVGLAQGFWRPIDNAATWLSDGAKRFGIDLDAAGKAIGLPTSDQTIQEHKDYVEGQRKGGVEPSGWGDFVGSAVSTLPVAFATKNPWIGGAAGGALNTSDPHSIQTTGTDAVVGGLLGKGASVVAPRLASAIGGGIDKAVATPAGKALAAGLQKVGGVPTSLKAKISSMVKGGASQADVDAVTDAAGVNRFDIGASAKYYATHPNETRAPGVITNADVGKALSTRQSGIRATKDLPPAAQEHYDRLTAQGLDPKEALREADILAVPGAKPTVAAVTRDPQEHAALYEGAKQATPEGRAVSVQIAQNNAALHAKVQNIIDDHGGIPAQGEAAQVSANSLAKASDAERATVTAKYKAAQKANDNIEAALPVAALQETLSSPSMDTASRQLKTGLRSTIKAMAAKNGGRFTPTELEQLRQSANAAYDKMGGPVNNTIGEVKSAIDGVLDQVADVSPLYKAARDAHKTWAAKYSNPKGVSSLIRRDAQGNFLHEDNWRAAEGFVAKTADKDFVQIVRQLAANKDEAALGRLKAGVLQRAYQRATRTAGDREGNATFNGKLFLDHLDQTGTAKLNALFSKSELAELASTGRAAIALNEPVPGSVNTSNTATALAKALEKMDPKERGLIGKGVKATAHLVAGHVMPGAANLGVEAVDHVGAKVASKSAQKSLAAALRGALDPEVARASAKAEAERLAAAMRRRSSTQLLTNRTAPLAGAAANRLRAGE